MTNASTIDRDIASRLNPIISSIGKNDTISQCAQLVQAMGLFLSKAEADDSRLTAYMLTDTIAAALQYEIAVSE